MEVASQRIRDKLCRGIPPNVAPVKTWAGYGTGLSCDGCELSIGSTEAEHEVELESGRTLRFHVARASLWQVLRTALPDSR
jgi:hypothetical protein